MLSHESHTSSLTVSSIMDTALIQQEVNQDLDLLRIMNEIQVDPLSHVKYSLEHNQLPYKNWFVMSSKSSLIPSILHTFHDSIMGGHSRFL